MANEQNATQRAADTLTGLARAAFDTQSALFGDMTKLLGELRFPELVPDPGVLMAAHRRNIDALSAANRLALEGAQAVGRRNMEIMQQTMAELAEHVRELASAHDPKARAERQAALIRQSYERAIGNLRELSELIQKSNEEAIKLLDTRFREAMEEVRQLVTKAGAAPHP